MEETDVLIIGAGIVGLATAYQIARHKPGLKITVLEKEKGPALHQTSHNSGVVHSGVYYKPGSLKAKNCLAGRKELLEFCDEHQIPYSPVTKLIMATDESELPRLQEIASRGKQHGLPGLELIGAERIREIEPAARGLQAIFLPQCHIIEYSQVAQKLCEILRDQGHNILFNQRVVKIGDTVETEGNSFKTNYLINCAGLFSDRIARMTTKVSHQIIPFRGEYYELKSRDLVRGLIYPVPDPRFPFLGVHFSKMLKGTIEAGPNAVLAFAREGYKSSDISLRDFREVLAYPGFWKMALRYWKAGAYEMYRSMSKKAFVKDLQKLIPDVRESDLVPGGSGVRAQMVLRWCKLQDDFALIEEKNTIHVLNAPSPAATASFAIGKYIVDKL